MKRRRTPRAASSATSAVSVRSISASRAPTSAAGRCQFSALKAYTVRQRTPQRWHARTQRLSAPTPARCPAAAGSPRAAAQRLLPSMMTATCAGSSSAGTPSSAAAAAAAEAASPSSPACGCVPRCAADSGAACVPGLPLLALPLLGACSALLLLTSTSAHAKAPQAAAAAAPALAVPASAAARQAAFAAEECWARSRRLQQLAGGGARPTQGGKQGLAAGSAWRALGPPIGSMVML